MESKVRQVQSGSEVANEKRYATREEVEKAIGSLTDVDHVKLMLIATSFCRERKFSSSVLEPGELLREAVLKTLRLDKKWNRQVSMIKHLDRAMENISGHLAKERSKIVSFPEGLPPDFFEVDDRPAQVSPDSSVAAEENARELLEAVFGDDEQAATILSMRTEGYEVADVMAKLRLSAQQYDTATKRMRRKIAKFLNDSKQK
jgi:DNA-directed RNA polymerase specialized sigma24 family protein